MADGAFPELLEKYAALQSPSRIEELVKIFVHATKVSASFLLSWKVGLTFLAADGDRLLGDGFRGRCRMIGKCMSVMLGISTLSYMALQSLVTLCIAPNERTDLRPALQEGCPVLLADTHR